MPPKRKRSIKNCSENEIRKRDTFKEAVDDSLMCAFVNVKEQGSLGLRVCYFADAGRGVVATRNFYPGDVICVYKGTLSSSLLEALASADLSSVPDFSSFLLEVGKRYVVDASAEPSDLQYGRLINHAKGRAANAYLQEKLIGNDKQPFVFIIARKAITIHEQILYDYSGRGYKFTDLTCPWLNQKATFRLIAGVPSDDSEEDVQNLLGYLISACEATITESRSASNHLDAVVQLPAANHDVFLPSVSEGIDSTDDECHLEEPDNIDVPEINALDTILANDSIWSPLLQPVPQSHVFSPYGQVVWALYRDKSFHWPAIVISPDAAEFISSPPGWITVKFLNTSHISLVDSADILAYDNFEFFMEQVREARTFDSVSFSNEVGESIRNFARVPLNDLDFLTAVAQAEQIPNKDPRGMNDFIDALADLAVSPTIVDVSWSGGHEEASVPKKKSTRFSRKKMKTHRRLICAACKDAFSNKALLASHLHVCKLRQSHQKQLHEQIRVCAACGGGFGTTKLLRKHFKCCEKGEQQVLLRFRSFLAEMNDLALQAQREHGLETFFAVRTPGVLVEKLGYISIEGTAFAMRLCFECRRYENVFHKFDRKDGPPPTKAAN